MLCRAMKSQDGRGAHKYCVAVTPRIFTGSPRSSTSTSLMRAQHDEPKGGYVRSLIGLISTKKGS